MSGPDLEIGAGADRLNNLIRDAEELMKASGLFAPTSISIIGTPIELHWGKLNNAWRIAARDSRAVEPLVSANLQTRLTLAPMIPSLFLKAQEARDLQARALHETAASLETWLLQTTSAGKAL